MKILQISRFVFSLILVWLLLVACSPDSGQVLGATIIPTDAVPILQSGQVRQWAAGAEASTEFADPEWAAIQATDAPNTTRCGDYQTAWASAGSDTVDTLVLTYTLSVHVTGINIVQSFNPNQVSKVELLGVFDRPTSVYDAQPNQVDQPCPYILSIPVEKTDTQFNKIRITVDQSILGLGWNQIDAVELVGDLE
ncbi:MAG: hypothetical protein ACK2U1_17715 [Anaerolineales bacterium]|jgi:hypothetical protein